MGDFEERGPSLRLKDAPSVVSLVAAGVIIASGIGQYYVSRAEMERVAREQESMGDRLDRLQSALYEEIVRRTQQSSELKEVRERVVACCPLQRRGRD